MTRNSKKLNRRPNTNFKPPQQNNPSTPASPRPDMDNPFGLSFVVPTEMVDLPSGGIYYPANSPAFGKKSLEIKHMTAREEDLLSSVDETNSDNIFERLIDGLLVDKNVSAKDLLEEDKMAILYNARKTGYGKNYTALSYCDSCKDTTEFVFDLEKVSVKNQNEDLDFDPETGCFTIELPVTGLEVKLRRMSTQDLEALQTEKQKKQGLGIEFNYTISYLTRAIFSVNEVQEKKMIMNLLAVMPAADAKFMMSYDKNLFPQIDTTQEVACTVCDTVAEREVPLSWAFFRSDV